MTITRKKNKDASRSSDSVVTKPVPAVRAGQSLPSTGAQSQFHWFSIVQVLPGIAAVFFFSVGLYYGTISFLNTTVGVFRYGPKASIAPELSQYVSRIRKVIPSGEAILYVGSSPEYWFSRLWQRALYPIPAFLVLGPDELRSPKIRTIRTRHTIRYAVSTGNPPLDPGYKWHTSWPAVPGTPGEV
ncbi:MAG TPA: hypothetical protein VG672_08930, partial [Bryobacteraceae bacterium]|nr:hypothetical protein [Bryobacteraceae bacterium]